MATIDKKLIHFNRKADFETRLAAGDIRDYSIVCIKDAKLIWTHGEYYGDLSECLQKYPQSFTQEEKSQMLENLGYYIIEWDGESETIDISEEELENLNSATVPVLLSGGAYMYPTQWVPSLVIVYSMEIHGCFLTATIDAYRSPLQVHVEETVIPTKLSDLENDLNFVSASDAGLEVDGVEVDYVTESELSSALEGKQNTITDLSTIRSGASKGATAVQPAELASVAKSGSYNDLTNKPTIPSAVTESTVSGWGFTKNTGTYSKPSAGIPKSDLASAVQTSLGKADTALQSYTEQYKGTVTGVKVNGSTKSPSSGTVDIGDVVTSIKINGSTKSPSSGAVDLGTVITSHQDISGKQDNLVSGTNIKTINGQSLLGEGDIQIQEGGGAEVPIVDHGTGDTTFVLTPNILHKWGTVTSLTLTLAVPTDTTIANYYMVQFTCGSSLTTLDLPDTIKWITEPNIEANKTYQISILDNLGVIGGA